jgi:hypothetical protein
MSPSASSPDEFDEGVRMGSFIYDGSANAFEVDDRTLAHVRIVVMNKLRRSEPFMFELTMRDGSGHRSFWIHQSVPLQFRIFDAHQVRINRLWIETLMKAASGPSGLFLSPEPAEQEHTVFRTDDPGREHPTAVSAPGAITRLQAPVGR